ncbi:MBL fold metallo-hydrolase [Ruminococcaceae bacterium OttesenSCG-928-L11]|nr:MBL fold metallo-hydrolase [Ruminococcaceae bacterium OttesenSCG-928-L11]
MSHPVFTKRLIQKGTWVISGEGCERYLLEGDDEAIMIDSGNSTHDIRAFASTLTDLPLTKVINTHSHFDHTGGNGFFETAITTVGVARSAKNTMSSRRENYPMDYPFTHVKDGDIIPLAGRPLHIIGLNCHSPDDIAVLDPTGRLLFTGDEVEAGQVLLLPGYAEQPGQIHAAPAGSVETCLNAMRKLKSFGDQFDALCPGHNGSPIDPCYLDWFIQLCQNILDGQEGNPDCSSPSYSHRMGHFPFPTANYRRGEYKGASLVYCADLLWDSDYAKADQLLPATPLHITSSYFVAP